MESILIQVSTRVKNKLDSVRQTGKSRKVVQHVENKGRAMLCIAVANC